MYIGAVLNGKKHITVAFNGHDETKRDYKNAVLALASSANRWQHGKITAAYTDLKRFEQAQVWVTLVDAPLLHWFRNDLIKSMDVRGVYWSNLFGFNPHVTMTKWGKPKQPLIGWFDIEKLSVVSDTFGTTDILL